jgi:integrase
MGAYIRPDSPVWWLFLETTHERTRTEIRVGTTTTQRRDSRKLAEDLYHQRMNQLAARLYRLPNAQPAIRFDKYAATYAIDVIALRKGADRERELLKALVANMGEELLTAIDADRVRVYVRARRQTVSAATVNREVDLLKGMLRDAVPKYLPASPIVGFKRLPVITPKRRLMTADEERRLLAACEDAEDRAILILGVDTLLRLGDLLDLKRADRAGLWLYIADPKSGIAFDVALSPRAARALDAIDHDAAYYFAKFRKAEKPRNWRGAVRKRLKYLCRHATPAIPYGKAENGLTFHWATRRTGATRMLIQKRVPVPVVQRHGNWKQPDVLLEIYTEAQRGDLLKAVGQPFTHRSRSKRKSA